jgi:hypothetical protein
MKYAVETGSGAMIHIPSLIKIGSGIQKLIEGTHIQKEDSISLLWESRLKNTRAQESYFSPPHREAFAF